ncbi:MAG: efflux RND transporter permease subunit, partial [Pseudomonadota bacterium]
MTNGPEPSQGGGLVGLFARHPTAGNLLMLLMIMAGVLALTNLNRQFFPDFGLDLIRVTVDWPGATAEDVESSIIEAIEPEVRFLDGIKRVTSSASEGLASVIIEFLPDTNMQKALSEVESAVDQVTTLPEDSERPEIAQLVRYDTVTRIVLSGPFSERTLRRFAKEIREDLLDRGVDRVTFFGMRDEEIRVELEPEALRRLDLTLDDVAEAIARSSQDLPAGALGGAFERQPRALGLARTGDEIAAIEVLATPSGRKLTVGDIGRVEDGFDRDEASAARLGELAIDLQVDRALTNDALTVADSVDRYLQSLEGTLPADLRIETYDVAANLIRDRIDLLLRSGLGGLILVLAVLFLFLNARVAFWIAAGIPISLMAMLGVLWLAGMTINMISLFAMILAIGIVVDDAIVVVENVQRLMEEEGLGPREAAHAAMEQVSGPI